MRGRVIAGTVAFIVAAAAPGGVSAGPPYVTDDPVPPDPGHWEFYVYAAGANAAGNTSGLGPAFEVNYGALPNLQLHAAGGLAYDDPSGGPERLGLSDTELGLKYRILNPAPADWWPQVGVFPQVEIPTGNARRLLGSGTTPVFLPVWLQQNIGKWTINTGGGYWINPGFGNRNYWFTGWLLQRQVTEKLALGAEVFYQTAATVGTTGATGFNLGAVYDFSEHEHLLVSAGQGGLPYAIDAAASHDPFTYYIGLQWTY